MEIAVDSIRGCRRFTPDRQKIHLQSRAVAKCRRRLSVDRRIDEKGVSSSRSGAAPAASLHPSIDHTNGADSGLQSAPLSRSAPLSLAVAQLGSFTGYGILMTQQPIANMLGIPREGALKAHSADLIDYSGGRIQVLNRRRWRGARASAMRWSRKSTTGSSR
jgi:hypothetical protein